MENDSHPKKRVRIAQTDNMDINYPVDNLINAFHGVSISSNTSEQTDKKMRIYDYELKKITNRIDSLQKDNTKFIMDIAQLQECIMDLTEKNTMLLSMIHNKPTSEMVIENTDTWMEYIN